MNIHPSLLPAFPGAHAHRDVLAYGAKIDADSWKIPKIFKLLQEWGNISRREMFRTFNCGIGMILIVDADIADEIDGLKIGQVVKNDEISITGGDFLV